MRVRENVFIVVIDGVGHCHRRPSRNRVLDILALELAFVEKGLVGCDSTDSQ